MQNKKWWSKRDEWNGLKVKQFVMHGMLLCSSSVSCCCETVVVCLWYQQKRRSSRVTKRQKYLEDVDLSDEDHLLLPSASETPDNSLMVNAVLLFSSDMQYSVVVVDDTDYVWNFKMHGTLIKGLVLCEYWKFLIESLTIYNIIYIIIYITL